MFVSGEGQRHDGQGWQCCSICQGINPTGENIELSRGFCHNKGL
jgi:hypothetical protein